MITVIIPTINDVNLTRTIQNVSENAKGDVEFIIVADGGTAPSIVGVTCIIHAETLGRRISINKAARIANGSHLFILDAHCSMTEGWDEKLLEACEDNTIVVCAIQDMMPDTWKFRAGVYNHVYLNTEYTEKWWHKAEQSIEEMMCFTGCAWLIPKNYFWALDGYDESLGKYGWDGPEWSLKVWLNDEYPGRVLLRSDVICGHIFGTNDGNILYPARTIGASLWYKYASEKWGHKVQALVKKFNPPGWAKEPKVQETIVHHTTVWKVDECTDRDTEGNVTRRYTKHYKPFTVHHDGKQSESEIAVAYTSQITEVDHEEDIPAEQVA